MRFSQLFRWRGNVGCRGKYYLVNGVLLWDSYPLSFDVILFVAGEK